MRYEEPKIEIVVFETEDILSTSTVVPDPTDNWGEVDWDN